MFNGVLVEITNGSTIIAQLNIDGTLKINGLVISVDNAMVSCKEMQEKWNSAHPVDGMSISIADQIESGVHQRED